MGDSIKDRKIRRTCAVAEPPRRKISLKGESKRVKEFRAAKKITSAATERTMPLSRIAKEYAERQKLLEGFLRARGEKLRPITFAHIFFYAFGENAARKKEFLQNAENLWEAISSKESGRFQSIVEEKMEQLLLEVADFAEQLGEEVPFGTFLFETMERLESLAQRKKGFDAVMDGGCPFLQGKPDWAALVWDAYGEYHDMLVTCCRSFLQRNAVDPTTGEIAKGEKGIEMAQAAVQRKPEEQAIARARIENFRELMEQALSEFKRADGAEEEGNAFLLHMLRSFQRSRKPRKKKQVSEKRAEERAEKIARARQEGIRIIRIKEEDRHWFECFIPEELLWLYRSKGKPTIALGIIQNGTACGALLSLFKHRESLEIMSIFVAEEFRGRGIGTALLDGFLRATKGLEDARSVDVFFCASLAEGRAFARFFRRLGFSAKRLKTGLYETTIGELYTTPFFSASKDAGDGSLPILPLEKIPAAILYEFSKRVDNEYYLDLPLHEIKEDRALSTGLLIDGQMEVCVVFDYSEGDHAITMAYLYISPVAVKHTAQFLRSALARINAVYPEETRVLISIAAEETGRFLQKIAGDVVRLVSAEIKCRYFPGEMHWKALEE